MHEKARKSWIKHLDFIIVDILFLFLSIWSSYFLRNGSKGIFWDSKYRTLMIIAVLVHMCVALSMNFYSGIVKRGYFIEFRKVIAHNMIVFGMILLYMFTLKEGETYSRAILISSFITNTVLMYITHCINKKICRTRRDKGTYRGSKNKMVVATTEKLAEGTLKSLANGPDGKYEIIGLSIKEEESTKTEIGGVPVVAHGRELYEFVCRNAVDTVLLCLDVKDMDSLQTIANELITTGVTVKIKLDIYFDELPNVSFGHINEANVITSSINSVSTSQLIMKRVIDIAAGIVGCLITGILYIFIAPAIKIADPKGPVFFSQERAGRNGRTFKFYKFRSMYADAEERKKELMKQNKMNGLMFKIDADPRIIGSGKDGTRKGLGHFLRASSLDEFPNFWSILKGDMSLVGTRPPTMDEYVRYEMHHKSRLATKPGLTGLWQVSGRSNMTDFEEIVKLDNEYLKNWSIPQDIKIIIKTVWVVLTRRGSV